MIQDDTSDGLRQGGRRGDQLPPVPDRQIPLSLGVQTQKRIGTHLRAMYDQVVQQPIPDRFKDLIDRLDDFPASDGKEAHSNG